MVLGSGLKLSALPLPGAPFVHLTLTLSRGMEAEGPGERGYLSLLSTLLFRGCGGLDRYSFARECDSLGADLQAHPGRDLFTLEAWVLPEDLGWVLGIFRRMLFEPAFEPEEVEVARREHLLQLEARQDEKRARLVDVCRRSLFLPSHHYSRPVLGEAPDMLKASRRNISSFFERFLDDVPAVLCVTGGFRQEVLLDLLDEQFSSPKFGSQEATPPALPAFRGERRKAVEIPFPVDQTEVLIGLPSLTRSDPSYRLASFCNEVFGGAFLSRLTRAVRMKEGMAYSAESRLNAGRVAGATWISLQTDRSNLRSALRTVRGCMDELRETGLGEEEFLHFKEFLSNSLPFDYDGLSDLTSRRLEEILFGELWPLEARLKEIEEKVTLPAANRFFTRWLDPEQAVVCVLGEGLESRSLQAFHEAGAEGTRSQPLTILAGPRARRESAGTAALVAEARHGSLYRFPSGIHLLSLPRPELAAVSLQIWSLTGSMDEDEGKTGLSHLLEHLMFRGTRRHPDGHFDAILAQKGGLNNAYTSEDFTVYLDYVAREGLEEALCLEADRFRNLELSEEIFETERSVVLEERSLRVDCHPLGLAHERLQQLAFPNHPYGHPVIGWRGDLEAATLEAVREHYERARKPERLLLVVAGGCPTDRALELAEKAFSNYARGVEKAWPVPAADLVEPLTRAGDALSERSGYSYLLLAYRFPREGHPDFEACELLSRIIGEGDSSLLYDTFVRERRKVMEVWVSYESQSRDHPLLYIGLANAGEIDAGLVGEVGSFLSALAPRLTSEELEKARRTWIAEEAFGTDELEEWALEIAGRVMLMPWEDVWRHRERVEAVTLQRLQEAAGRYLAEDRFVHVLLRGEAEGGKKVEPD